MAKLHELLAVEGNLKAQAAKTITELLSTFEKKRHLFQKTITVFQSNEENSKPVEEQRSELNTTVAKEIDWLRTFVTKAIDAGYQVNEANMTARADVVLEETGDVILKNVPATALLELEKHLRGLQEFIQKIPTLDPAKGFSLDPDQGDGVYVARTVTKTRTRKQKRVIQLAKATDKHPEQVALIDEDVAIGEIREQEWSGLITTARKSLLLERVEDLTRAVKKARSRANEKDIEVQSNKVARQLLDFVFAE